MLAIGTRFFGKDPEKDLPRLKRFITAASPIADAVYVAIDPHRDWTDALTFVAHAYAQTHVHQICVTPWGKCIPALNAIVSRAAAAWADHLLLASAEFPPERAQVQALMAHMDDDTLVAGARFAEHEFLPGYKVAGTGVTMPWNTFALWNLPMLMRLGFPLSGEALFDTAEAGNEELVTIALYQQLYPGKANAKLIEVAGIGGAWNMKGWDDARRKAHEAKISTKIERASAQRVYAGLKPPTILHMLPMTP